MTKTYVTTVIEEGDNLVLPFPDSLMEDMGWKAGDVLEWTVEKDHATIRKVEDPTLVMRALEGYPEHEVSSTQ
jgi:bifunctional DNA-binding transcriptional regulator/antitoxin component of YhaV-PrlF toxin-antitoxin module